MVSDKYLVLKHRIKALTEKLHHQSGLLGATVVACLGWLAAARPLADNSLFTHIVTGRYIWQTRSVPTGDIYSFAAEGTPWVVQSWLASFMYGAIETLTGGLGIRAFAGVLGATTLVLAWNLTRRLAFKPRLFVFAPVVFTALLTWNARPSLWALLFLVVTITATRRTGRVWWMAVVGLLWVNVHGSWVVALATLTVLALADYVDNVALTRRGLKALECLGWLAAGLVAGAVLGPLGGKTLSFPFSFAGRSEQLQTILEWRSFQYTNLAFVALLLQAAIVFAFKVEDKKWKGTAIIWVFSIGLALLAVRNIQMASLILLAPLVTLPSTSRRSTVKPGKTFLAAICLLATSIAFFVLPTWDFREYPTGAVEHIRNMDEKPLRLFSSVRPNSYIELSFNGSVKIFVDDRFDMYPIEQLDDFTLLNSPDVENKEKLVVMQKYDFDAALLGSATSLAEDLINSGWRVEFSDEQWVLLVSPSA